MLTRYTCFCGLVSAVMIALCITGIAGIPADMTNLTADMTNLTAAMKNLTSNIISEPSEQTTQKNEQPKESERVVTTEATSINEVGSINEVELRANWKYGKAFSFNMTCYHYNLTECVYSMRMLNVSHEHVPDCTPKIINCSKKKEFCINMFYIVDRNSSILQHHNGLIYSGCSFSGNGLRPQYNDGECTYTDNPDLRYTVDNTTSARCYCRGKLCNEWRKPYKELRHPRDSYIAYSDYDTTTLQYTSSATTPYVQAYSQAEILVTATMSAITVVVLAVPFAGFIIWRKRWYPMCMAKKSTTGSNNMNDPSISDASGDTISGVVIDRMELTLAIMVLQKQGKLSKVYMPVGLNQNCEAVAKVYRDEKLLHPQRQS